MSTRYLCRSHMNTEPDKLPTATYCPLGLHPSRQQCALSRKSSWLIWCTVSIMRRSTSESVWSLLAVMQYSPEPEADRQTNGAKCLVAISCEESRARVSQHLMVRSWCADKKLVAMTPRQTSTADERLEYDVM